MNKTTLTVIIFIYLIPFYCVAAESYLSESVVTIAAGEGKSIKIETSKDVSVNVAFIGTPYKETEKCGKCLHLSHKLSDGYIPQSSSSNYGVGFIKVTPENGIIEIIIKHDYKSSKNIELSVKEYKPND